MKPLNAVLTGAVVLAALGGLPGAPARAEVGVRVSGDFTTHHGHGRSRRGPHYSHGVPFESRTRRHPRRTIQRSHGVPFLSRGHDGHASGAHVLGRRDRHVLGAGCRPFTRRSYDRRGHLVIEHLSKCHDRYGRPYILGGHRR